jgi:3-isopropylmalate/(R)-2-methylmalate dehydratase small subunit
VDGAFLLPIEIDENAYQNISEGDEIDINVSLNEVKNITKNQTYKMKPFSEIIGKIIESGGLFKYKPN